jgi:uncharacterized coiled-coil DUF342 family protein
MDNKELLEQLKKCLSICDSLKAEKKELTQQLEETKQENEQLSKTLVEANNAVVETIEVLGKTNESIMEFKEGVLNYQAYVTVSLDNMYKKVNSIIENEEVKKEDLSNFKAEVENTIKELEELNKGLS